MTAMTAQRKARRHSKPAKDREFENLLRRAAAFSRDRKRPHVLKVVKKKRATAAKSRAQGLP